MFNHKKKTWTKLSTSPSNQNQPKKKTCVFFSNLSPHGFFINKKKMLRFTFRPTPINWGASCGRFIEPANLETPIPGRSPRGPSWIIIWPLLYEWKLKTHIWVATNQKYEIIWNYMLNMIVAFHMIKYSTTQHFHGKNTSPNHALKSGLSRVGEE